MRSTSNETLGPLDRQKLRELAARWEATARQQESKQASAESQLEKRLLAMDGRVLRACAQDLKNLADGKKVERRG